MSLPSTWTEVDLLDVCTINPKAEQRLSPDTAVSMLRIASLQALEGSAMVYDVERLGELRSNARNFFRHNDVLIATAGNRVMESVLATDLPTEVGAANYFLVLRTGPELLPEYLLHYVRQPWFRQAAINTNRGTGHQMAIPMQFFRDVKLALPPIPEQRFLVDLFRKASLAPYKNALELAHQTAAVLAQELMVSSDEASMWPEVSLSALCTLNPQHNKAWESLPDAAAKYYAPTDAQGLNQDVDPLYTRAKDVPGIAIEVRPGDILFDPRGNTRLPARIVVVAQDDRVRHFASREFQVLRPDIRITSDYLARILAAPWMHNALASRNRGRLSRHVMEALTVGLPAIQRQHEILKLIDRVPTQRLADALEIAAQLVPVLYSEGFSGGLSHLWRTSRLADTPTVAAAPLEPSVHASPAQTDYAPIKRTARQTLISQLSSVQANVWAALCERRHPLIIDDSDAVTALCLGLQTKVSVSPVALKRALQQLAALGLIRKMSIPASQGAFTTAVRRVGIAQSGKAAEDSATRDAQLFRDNIAALEGGQ